MIQRGLMTTPVTIVQVDSTNEADGKAVFPGCLY
jgi:hypothetical protein